MFKIDWITASWKSEDEYIVEGVEHARVVARRLINDSDLLEELGYPERAGQSQRFYKYSFALSGGGRIDIAEDVQRQGVRLVLGGKALSFDKSGGEILLEELLFHNWNITRLDVAYDQIGVGDSVEDYANWWLQSKGGDTRTRYQVIAGESVETFVVGSRKSEVYGRCYDKGIEQGTDYKWVRFELEFKGAAAAQVARAAVHGAGAVSEMMIKHFRLDGHVTSDIMHVMGTGVKQAEYIRHRPVSAREKWLIEQVYPALKTFADEEPERALEIALQFLSGIQQLIENKQG